MRSHPVVQALLDHAPGLGLLALAGLLVLAPAAGHAQVIRGRVVAWPDSAPVPNAAVAALDTLGDRRASARTDSIGSFRLPLPAPGRFRLRVVHPAHDTAITDTMALLMAEELDVEVRLGPLPDTVPALVIRERDRSAWSYLRPYYRRLEHFGDAEPEIFITREELDSLGVSTIGRAVLLLGRGSSFPGTGGGGSCVPSVFWNGLRMFDRWHPFQSEAGRSSTAGVEGIELYPADHPREPMNVRDERCGSILIWTQPGPSQGGGLRDVLTAAVILVVGLLVFFTVGS